MQLKSTRVNFSACSTLSHSKLQQRYVHKVSRLLTVQQQCILHRRMCVATVAGAAAAFALLAAAAAAVTHAYIQRDERV